MRQEAAVILELAFKASNGDKVSWKKAGERMWEQSRMYARQLIESYNAAPLFLRNPFPHPFGCLQSQSGD